MDVALLRSLSLTLSGAPEVWAPARLLMKENSWRPLLSRLLLGQWATPWNQPECQDMEARRMEQRKRVLVFGALGCASVIKCCCRKINPLPNEEKKKLLWELLQWFNLLFIHQLHQPWCFFGVLFYHMKPEPNNQAFQLLYHSYSLLHHSSL